MILISLFKNLVNEPTWCSIKYAFRLKRFEQISQTYSLAEEEEDIFFLASFLPQGLSQWSIMWENLSNVFRHVEQVVPFLPNSWLLMWRSVLLETPGDRNTATEWPSWDDLRWNHDALWISWDTGITVTPLIGRWALLSFSSMRSWTDPSSDSEESMSESRMVCS